MICYDGKNFDFVNVEDLMMLIEVVLCVVRVGGGIVVDYFFKGVSL